MAWTLWTVVLTAVFVGYGTTFRDLTWSAETVGRSLLISAVVVLGSAAMATALGRLKGIE